VRRSAGPPHRRRFRTRARSRRSAAGPTGASAGVRVGWLLTHNLGIEALLEGGSVNVGPGCAIASGECVTPSPQAASYSLSSTRLGAAGRFLSNGDTWRFLGGGGLGAVRHAIDVSASPGALVPSGKTSALNGFLLLEGGGEVSIGRVLVDAVLTVTIDGVSNLKIGEQKLYTAHAGNITYSGVGLRVGYALW
jgi:hypothetical protein